MRVAFPPPTAQPQVILSFGKKLQIPGFSSQEQIIYTHFPKEQIQKIYLRLKEDTVYHNTVNQALKQGQLVFMQIIPSSQLGSIFCFFLGLCDGSPGIYGV